MTSTDLTQGWNDLTARVARWFVPTLAGAFLVMLLNYSGERKISSGALDRVSKLEAQLELLQRDLAAGGPPALSRRVDDLSNAVERQFSDVSKKLDAIQALLMRGR